MTPEQVTLVKESWAQVVPIAEQAAELFYAKLFELDPTLREMFPNDMQDQGRKLMATISTAVSALDRLDTIVPTVQELGRRHVGYGVKEEHYETVGAALLWTLEQGLGEAFTPPVKAAWTETYTLLAATMKTAARAAA